MLDFENQGFNNPGSLGNQGLKTYPWLPSRPRLTKGAVSGAAMQYFALPLLAAQVVRMLLAMKENEHLAPMHLGIFSAHVVVQISNLLSHLIAQSRRFKWRYISQRKRLRPLLRGDGANGWTGVKKKLDMIASKYSG